MVLATQPASAASTVASTVGAGAAPDDVAIVCLETGNKFSAVLADVKAMSGTIRAMIEDLDVDGTDPTEIPVAGVTDEQLSAILTFIKASSKGNPPTTLHFLKGGDGDDDAVPTNMADLLALAQSSNIAGLAAAANMLDIPKLLTTILTVVGTAIVSEAANRKITKFVAPNGKLSIECAAPDSSAWHSTASVKPSVKMLAKLVSELREVEPELVDGELTKVVHEQQVDYPALYNYLIEKQFKDPSEDAIVQVKEKYTTQESARRVQGGYHEMYTPEAAAASWDGIEKHSMPTVTDAGFGDAIYKVLKQVHPDEEISAKGMMVVDDLVAHMLHTLATAAGRNNDMHTSTFGGVPTRTYLDPSKAEDAGFDGVTVLQTRTKPSDQVLFTYTQAMGDSMWWEPRGEAVRVGLGPAVAAFEAQTPAEKEEDLLQICKDSCEGPEVLTSLNGLSSRDVQTAVRQLFPGELAKHAVSEGTKAVTKYVSRGVDIDGIDDDLKYGGKTAAEVGERINSAAGLQFPVLKVAQRMHGCTGKPPSTLAATYMAAVLEYLSAEMLELGGNVAKDKRCSWIQPPHLHCAIARDEELACMFSSCSILDGGVQQKIHSSLIPRKNDSGGPSQREERRARGCDQPPVLSELEDTIPGFLACRRR